MRPNPCTGGPPRAATPTHGPVIKCAIGHFPVIRVVLTINKVHRMYSVKLFSIQNF